MRFWPLTTNERAENSFTHAIEITADDLTQTTTNTAQTLTTPLIFAVGDIVTRVRTRLKTAFKDASDSAFNSDTMSVGDSVGGVATILAAIEMNENGSEITDKTAVPSGTPFTGFTSASTMTVTFNSMSAKALNDIDTGVLIVQVEVKRAGLIPNAIDAGPRTTK